MSARLFVLLIVMAIPGAGSAQGFAERPLRRVEIDAGGGILGGAALGSADATLRGSDPMGQPFRLFSVSSRFAPAPAFHVRAGFAFNRRIGVEGGLQFSRPDIRSSTSADAENAPAITVAERVDQYCFDASLVIMLDELRAGDRTVPFVVAGGGYLRQLHEGLTLVQEGRVYHAGGGVKHWLVARDRGFVRAAGLRADARLYLMAGGISFDGRPRPHGAISGSVFVTF